MSKTLRDVINDAGLKSPQLAQLNPPTAPLTVTHDTMQLYDVALNMFKMNTELSLMLSEATQRIVELESIIANNNIANNAIAPLGK
jgi:hypothetical protein